MAGFTLPVQYYIHTCTHVVRGHRSNLREIPNTSNGLRLQRWKEEREKISDWYKPIKKCSRHAHESIKPRLYQTGALEVGAEKKFQYGNLYVLRALGGPP